MRKNILSVINAFLNHTPHREATCSTDGQRIFSYGMLIAETINNESVWIVPVSASPSRTTTSQVRACELELSRTLDVTNERPLTLS